MALEPESNGNTRNGSRDCAFVNGPCSMLLVLGVLRRVNYCKLFTPFLSYIDIPGAGLIPHMKDPSLVRITGLNGLYISD